jgi:glutamate synthase (NADPH/NADH) small chain
MGKPTGFKEFNRQSPARRAVDLRVLDYADVYLSLPPDKLGEQAARCMNCGITWCSSACPLGNVPAEWNDHVYRGRHDKALKALLKTNNFPEFTSRVCPALCEESCTLNLWKTPVSNRAIEFGIIERAFAEGRMVPQPPSRRTGKKVAIVGSGPSGLAAADQLNRAGHLVTVFERSDRIGGLLTYGIPNFKLEKSIVDRRIRLMEAEGIRFVTSADVGNSVPIDGLRREYDALVLCIGSTSPRDLAVPGRELSGIHLAMEYLPKQTKVVLGDPEQGAPITAEGKHVVVIGGGDTGADCVGTAVRQGAKSVRQLELLPQPPADRTAEMRWPQWPMILRTSASHEEASALLNHDREIRDWSVNTTHFTGDEAGHVRQLHAFRISWSKGSDGRLTFTEVPNSGFKLDCDLCLLALGFVGPQKLGLIEQLGLELDARGNIAVESSYQTSMPGVFAAGDARRGQSLVAWAMSEGRQAAHGADTYLMGQSDLPMLRLS